MSKEQKAYALLKEAMTFHENGNPTFKDSHFTPAQLMAYIVNQDMISEFADKNCFSMQHATSLFTALSYLFTSDWIKSIIK